MVAEAIEAALYQELGNHGEILTGWVVIGEFADGEGSRRLARMRAPYQTEWATLGMLHVGLYTEMEPLDGPDE